MSAEKIQFEQTIYIKASKEKVFTALTSPSTVSQYYMCPAKRIGTQKGDKIIYGIGQQNLIVGEIEKFEKNKIFAHSFQFVQEDADLSKTTKVSYELEELKDNKGITILHLRHTGFTEKDQDYHDITGGWPYILSNLKTFLETGKTLHQN